MGPSQSPREPARRRRFCCANFASVITFLPEAALPRAQAGDLFKNLAGKVKLQVEGPFLTGLDYKNAYSTSSSRFLMRKYSFEDGKLFVRPDSVRYQAFGESRT